MGSGLLTPGHLIIVLVIALIVFGPKRLPELGRSLGSGIRDFKHAIDSDDDEPATIQKPTEKLPAHIAKAKDRETVLRSQSPFWIASRDSVVFESRGAGGT